MKKRIKAQEYYQGMARSWEDLFSSFSREEREEMYKEIGFVKGFSAYLNPFLMDLNKELSVKPMLDFGCNTGEFLTYFSLLECEKYGLDINEKAILRAKENFPQFHFIHSLDLCLPFPNDFFSLLTLSGVLRYIRYEDREFYYDEFKRVSEYILVSDLSSTEKNREELGDFTVYYSDFQNDLSKRFRRIREVEVETESFGKHFLALYKL